MLGGTTVQVPPWNLTGLDDPASFCLSPNATNAVDDYSFFFQPENLSAALQRYLPSNESSDTDCDLVNVDAHSCDHFRMFEFKVRKCTRARSHDWTECPFAHPGEKARRRDPRKFHYSGTACPDFRNGTCRKGDACDCAHGVFECWLHPARYRTQPCKDGMNCTRRVCFFAHSPDQLRAISPRADSFDGSPRRFPFMSSPESVSPTAESPPMSPSVNQLVASLRQLQLNKLKAVSNSWVVGGSSSSPRVNMLNQPGFFSLPNTPTPSVARRGIGYFDAWDNAVNEEEPVMERVESGKDLRTKMFEKLSKENPLDRANPDVGWVSDLLE